MKVATFVVVVGLAAVARAASWRERRDADDSGTLAAAPAEAALDAEVFGADPGQRTDREKRLLLEHKVQIGNHIKNAVLDLIFGKINGLIDTKSSLIGVFERANAAKNLALLGPGTKRPAGSGIKGVLSGFLSSSAGSSAGSLLPSLSGVSGSSSGGGGGGGGGDTDNSGDFGAGASFGATLGGSTDGSESSASSSSSSSSSSGGPTTDNIPTFEGNRVSLEIPEQLFGSSFTLVTNISQILGDVILNTARRVQRFVEALKPKFRGLFGVQQDAAAAKKRATDDEIARAREASAAASDLDDLADNTADSRGGSTASAKASAALSKTSAKTSAKSSAGRSGAFKSLTGLEPFDFDFVALDKLVQSGDKASGVPAFKPLPSSVDLPGAVSQAGDILRGSLKRVPVRRRR